MSYCRWSSDDFSCDLYCYEHVDGTWTTHVASTRYVGEVPTLPLFPQVADASEWIAAKKAQTSWLSKAETAPIGLPHDGETFKDPTLEAFLSRLLALRSVGYSFPDGVLYTVRQEIAAAPAQPPGADTE